MILLVNVLSVLILLAIAVFLFLFLLAGLTTRAPFVPVRKAILSQIVRALELKEGSVVYDLGCGDGRVLIACRDACPKARYIGFDKDGIPYSLARLRTIGKKGIEIRMRDFFKQDLSQATHVFTYLYPELMDELLSKFQKELKPGARLVSCDFGFSQKEPDWIIDLNRPDEKLGKKLLVYIF